MFAVTMRRVVVASSRSVSSFGSRQAAVRVRTLVATSSQQPDFVRAAIHKLLETKASENEGLISDQVLQQAAKAYEVNFPIIWPAQSW